MFFKIKYVVFNLKEKKRKHFEVDIVQSLRTNATVLMPDSILGFENSLFLTSSVLELFVCRLQQQSGKQHLHKYSWSSLGHIYPNISRVYGFNLTDVHCLARLCWE